MGSHRPIAQVLGSGGGAGGGGARPQQRHVHFAPAGEEGRPQDPFDKLAGTWTKIMIRASRGGRRASSSYALDDPSAWVEAKLRKPGAVAVMLPAGAGACCPDELEQQSLRTFKERAVADTSYCGVPHRVWLLELEKHEPEEPQALQLHWLGLLAEHSTSAHRPQHGPWIWPLHDSKVSAAILAACARQPGRLPWWRHLLWALRLAAPPGGAETEQQIAGHYGAAVAYVFAWTNLYILGLWVLVLTFPALALVFGVAPDDTGTPRGYAWNCMQLLAMLWSMFLATEGHSQRRVLSMGGFEAVAAAAKQHSWKPIKIESTDAALRRAGMPGHAAAPAPGWSASALLTARAEAARREKVRGEGPEAGRLRLRGDQAAARQLRLARQSLADSTMGACWRPLLVDRGERPESQAQLQAVRRIQAHVRGHLVRKSLRARVQHQILLAARVGNVLEVLRHRNWAYRPPRTLRARLVQPAVAGLVTLLTVAAFSMLCVLVLLAFVQLNIWLTFIWGRCLDEEVKQRAAALGQECRDPEFVHGFRGWLAEVSSDVSLALLFDVLLAEAAKVVARHLVTLRNYELLYDKRYATVMLSLFIEALSKVGMFTIVAFAFLPNWPSHVQDSGGVKSPSEACEGFPDYELCKVVFDCRVGLDPDCCKGAMLCIARQLDFEQRKRMFQRAVKGPFCVAPFVRILVTVLIPWLTAWLEEFVAVDARDACAARAAASVAERLAPAIGRCNARRARLCLTPLMRILALIFHLDPGNVGGLRYLARGWPFGWVDVEAPGGDLEAAEDSRAMVLGALDQATRKAFEPFDELMELKMNFLFVGFFAPVMPLGLVPTLVARLLEVRSKVTKLLFVRRRCWPGEARLLHETQDCFAHIAAHVSVVWHTGLIVLSYNRELALWGFWKTFWAWFTSIVVVTFTLHAVSELLHRCRCKAPQGVDP